MLLYGDPSSASLGHHSGKKGLEKGMVHYFYLKTRYNGSFFLSGTQCNNNWKEQDQCISDVKDKHKISCFSF